MIQYKQILMTLALLLTAATGAWAQGVTITFAANGNTKTVENVTLPKTFQCSYNSADGELDLILKELYGWTGDADVTFCLKRTSPTSSDANKVVAGKNGNDHYITINNVFEGTVTITGGYIVSYDQKSYTLEISVVDPNGIEVTPVAGKTNEWTFAMPGSDVVLTPQYAPAAQLAENGAPAAVSGLEIAADAAIITAGQSAQGTLLYAVGTSETEKPALTAFAATLPNAKDQTAAGNYYVWYYIQGQDTPQGQEPTAENTFNDSEIMGPVMVELLTNEHTLNIKQSPNITVTVAGTAVTPTDDKVTPVTTGQEVKIKAKEGYKFRKVEVKKGAAGKTITIGDMELTYADGDTWETIVSKNSDKIKTIAGGYIVQVAQPAPDTYKYIHVWYTKVNPSDIIDPSKNYQWGTMEVAW